MGGRTPAAPPALAGFTYVGLLGSGGFADVYLYEQQLPQRTVAVKVLLAERAAGDEAARFTAEANVMALLSTHPAIVTIYQAGISADDRPYLVMEYCPRPNLQARYRAAPFSVAEALRVGIQVAAAVETAHRAGILHRDIKPANILVTSYNRPALTDFGIATTAAAAVDDSWGMSIPWSPPETFADVPTSSVAADVWSLAATVYTLLAGRSPFERSDARNSAVDLIDRIETEPVPALDRDDVPSSLQAALERGMSKDPRDRHGSALDFARALQRVQIELAHAVTPIDLLDDDQGGAGDAEHDEDDDELTRVRGIVSIQPQTAPAVGRTRRRSEDAPAGTAAASVGAEASDATLVRGPRTEPGGGEVPVPVAPVGLDAPGAPGAAPAADAGAAGAFAPVPEAPPRRGRRGVWFAGVAGAVVVIVGAVVGASLLVPPPAPPPATPDVVEPQDPSAGFVPVPADGTGAVSGDQAVFTWTNPDPLAGDSFIWQPVTLDGLGAPARVGEPTITLPADPAGRTCIEVALRRESGAASDPARICTP